MVRTTLRGSSASGYIAQLEVVIYAQSTWINYGSTFIKNKKCSSPLCLYMFTFQKKKDNFFAFVGIRVIKCPGNVEMFTGELCDTFSYL